MKKRFNQKREIFWNVVNALLAGALVFLGSLTSGTFSWKGVLFGFVAAGVITITKFKDYWAREEKEYSCKRVGVFHFIG